MVIQRIDEAEQRVGGIIIPDSAKEKPQQGTVTAGHGKTTDAGKRVPLDIKAGDRILFGKFSGQEVTLDDVEYLVMKADDVLAVLEGPGTQKGTMVTRGTKKTTTKKSKSMVSKGMSMERAQRTPKKKR